MGNKSIDCKKPKRGPKRKKITYQRRVFTLTDDEAQETLTVVTGTLLVNGNSAKVLFDSGAMHSFISNGFAKSLRCHCLRTVDDEFWVRTPMGADVRITHRIPSLEVNLIKSV